jgi:preprotein translocase subunit SecA
MVKWFSGIFDSNEKELKKLEPLVRHINSLEEEFEGLTDDGLWAKTEEFKGRLGEGQTLDDLLPDAFAIVREAAKRTLGQRQFDVQLMGGIVLHQGKIAEMKTGEGKTLVATLPLYLNSLTGQSCHLVTVNDYLARRDPCWMGPIYHVLGVSVASVGPGFSYVYDPSFEEGEGRWKHLRPVSRKEAYQADIVYGTNNEFGFDYLRDNMVSDLSQCTQRGLDYAIVDEVDNILIDEARTPLIISGRSGESTQAYPIFSAIVPHLKRGEGYEVDEKTRSVSLTDEGISNVEVMLKDKGLLKSKSLYDPQNYILTYYLDNALKAHTLYRRDRDYMVKNGQVIIVDEFTGRMLPGRRYSEGLHQALEAKEGVKIQEESVTLATITFQNYFRMYDKLSGMTGTAATEAEELHKIYKLEVLVIPTYKPMIREDHPDRVYKNERVKFGGVVQKIEELYQKGRPVLVGTTSVEKSEYLSDLLDKKGIPHEVLNAKQHEREAIVIERAGQPQAVTIATSMAGRGVDIALGPGVVEKGGLFILGTEHYEARRVDNQLRGRSGRQGDPGESCFYASLEDDIMRRFGGGRVEKVMEWAGMAEDEPIENAMVTRAISNAQARMEGYHFDLRKHLVEYDDVVNKHREVIYRERGRILASESLKENIKSMVEEEVLSLAQSYLDGTEPDVIGLTQELRGIFPSLPPLDHSTDRDEMPQKILEYAELMYERKERELGSDMRMLERMVMLSAVDRLWTQHLTMVENMRQGVGLEAVGHNNPLVVYKSKGHLLFQDLLENIRHTVVRMIYQANVIRRQERPEASRMERSKVKVGRNDPCPCGSGKKYKHCCGRNL